MAWSAELDVLERAIRQAGQAVQTLVAEGFATAHKANQDPVTTADLEANRILHTAFEAHFPDYGWLSEETRDNPSRLQKARVWIVDPVDGTKELVTGIPEYAVSVALVEHGRPVVGAIYNPATDELVIGAQGLGTFYNGRPAFADFPLGEKPVLLASRSEIKRGEFAPFEAVAEVKPMGSIAYKLGLIAAGRADATFSLGPKNEWDIAAGILLVEEAGGYVADQTGRPFVLNQANTLVNGIVATTPAAQPQVLAMIQQMTA